MPSTIHSPEQQLQTHRKYITPFIDKVVVITGGASGIGRSLCKELGRRGAIVNVVDINEVGAEETADLIRQAGGQATAMRLDVTNEVDVTAAIAQVVSTHGRLDYIFNNAGIAVFSEAYNLPLDQWRKIIDVNLWGVIYGSMAAYQVMRKQGFGHIVNVSSLGGLMGSPMLASYSASKYAVIGLSNSLRAEAEDFGVKVSTICPGYVKTAMSSEIKTIKISREALLTAYPESYFMETDQAVERILAGVCKNEAIVIFPFSARLLWWVSRLHGGLLEKVQRTIVKMIRGLPVDESSEMALSQKN
jgi:NAD(P)-dependent dehydrogenase (short-subunit alcohol dehydrogenase family)